MIRNISLCAIIIASLSIVLPASAEADSDRQLLVIPLVGTDTLGDTGKSINKAVWRSAAKSGATLIKAKVNSMDIVAMAGCHAGSSDCYVSITTTLGVQEIVFGSARADGEKITIKVTWVRAGQSVKHAQVRINSGANAAKELETKLEPFFTGKEMPKPPENKPPKPTPPKPTPPKPVPPKPIDVKPPPKTKKAPGFSLSRVRGSSWAIFGGGLGAAGVGAVFLYLTGNKQKEIDDAPTDTLDDLKRLEDLEASGRRYNVLGTSFVIAGSVAAVLGTVLIWRQGSRVPTDKPITVAPVLTPGGAGLTVRLALDL